MRKVPSDMVAGTRHMSNAYGELEIIEYVKTHNVRVRFIKTGFDTIAQAGDIRRGIVKDKLHQSIHGVGYIGVGDFNAVVNRNKTKEYKTWKNMLRRCYDTDFLIDHPSYIGCSVCNEWHNFQNFAEWMTAQDHNDKQLDKDIKVKGNKVYSPETCSFVTHAENSIEANAKHYTFISPEGLVADIYNLAEFCRKNELNHGRMSKVNLGKAEQHKGWKKA